MKIQRKIAVLLCCLAFMGMFSLDVLSAQAACSHETCFEFFDYKTYYYKADGHYGDWGLTHICTSCGYQYWDDSTLRYLKIEDHKYLNFEFYYSTDWADVYIADCETPECDYIELRYYYK